MKDRLENYKAKLARMIPGSTQYIDQNKRIRSYEKSGRIAMGKRE